MSSPILPSPIMTSSNQDDEHRPASPPIVPTPLVIGGSNIPDLPINPTPQSPHVKPRALIVVGDGSEEMEVLTLSDLLALGGMHVTLAALGRNPSNVVEGNFGLRIRTDQSIEDSSFGTYELIVIPGVSKPHSSFVSQLHSKQVTCTFICVDSDGIALPSSLCRAMASSDTWSASC